MLKGKDEEMVQRKPNEPKTKEYASFRHQVDKLTCSMFPKYTEVNQRMERGAEIYKATNPDSEAEVNSDEESMSDDESMSISEEKIGYYHCYKSCATYDDRCTYPEECEQQKRQ